MKHALAFGAIVAMFAFLAHGQVSRDPYYYDEADYMFAASLGANANWIDAPSQSLVEFVGVGLRDGRDSSKRAELSAAAREGSDVDFYRHWHGPLYFYWLTFLSPFNRDEHAWRTLSYVFPLLTAAVMYFGCLWISTGVSSAILSAAFFLWSYATVFTSEIAPHQLFVLCSVASLILLMKWRETNRARLWYGSVIAAACAFCTLEVAFVLVFVLIMCASRVPSIFKSVLVFVITVAVIWPAALVKLTFLKAYLFMGYLAMFRSSAWGDAGLLETWRGRFARAPIEWLVLAVAAVLYFRSTPYARRRLFPLLIYGGLMFIVLLRVNSQTPRYTVPYLPALQFAAGCVLADAIRNWKPPLRSAVVAAIVAAVFFDTVAAVHAHPVRPSPRLEEILAAIRAANLDGKMLLAPQNDLPMIHFYFPQVHSRGYADDGERRTILAMNEFDAVLDPGYPVALWRRSSDSAHYVSH